MMCTIEAKHGWESSCVTGITLETTPYVKYMGSYTTFEKKNSSPNQPRGRYVINGGYPLFRRSVIPKVRYSENV